jgi:hypothetical protein
VTDEARAKTNETGWLIYSTRTSSGNRVDVRYLNEVNATVHLDDEWIGTVFSNEDVTPPFMFALVCAGDPEGMAKLYLEEFSTADAVIEACVETEMERRTSA